MKISSRGRYALRLMVELARSDSSTWVALSDISAKQDISVKYLEQIVPNLVKGGLVQSSRGSQGGYRLAKDAENYTTGEILRAVVGSLAPVACLDSDEGCARRQHCSTIKFWAGLNQVINNYVDSVSLSDLAKADHSILDFQI